jgi:hypothetical protein
MRNILILSGLLSLTGTAIADPIVEPEWMKEAYPVDVTLVEGVDMVIKDGVTLCMTTVPDVEETTDIVIDCNGNRTLRTVTVSSDNSKQESGLEVIKADVVSVKIIAPSGVKITDELASSLYREALGLNLSDAYRSFIEEALKRLEGDFNVGSVLHRDSYTPYSTYRLSAAAPSGRWAWGQNINTTSWHEIYVTINMGALYSWQFQQKVNGSTRTVADSDQFGAGAHWKQLSQTLLTVFISKPGIYQTYAHTAIGGGGLDGMVENRSEITAQ